jgi:hypothetical protein
MTDINIKRHRRTVSAIRTVRMFGLFALAAVSMSVPTARAQDMNTGAGTPGCLENICGGNDMQPSEGQVQSLEQQDGVAPSAAQEKKTDATLDRLYKELERPVDGGGAKPK